MLMVSGVKKRYLAIVLIAGILLSVVSWIFLFKDYQKERITTVIDPMSSPKDSGYNLIQATVAVGSGGMWGKGLGHGSQSQLNFLPEKHTDFIYAVTAEELGFVGSLFLLGLLAIMVVRLTQIAQSAPDNFGRLFATGVSIVIFIQTFVNVGMNIGIMPITGIPLPFLSYGGSALISLMAAMGVVENIAIRRKVAI
jgi:rod shape determining protein RodA